MVGVSRISVYGKDSAGVQKSSQVMTKLPVKFGLTLAAHSRHSWIL